MMVAISSTISSPSQATFTTVIRTASSSLSTSAAPRAPENLTKASRIVIRPCFALMVSRPINHFIIRCSNLDSPVNLLTTVTETVDFLRGLGLTGEEIEFLLEKNAFLRTTPCARLRDRVLCLESVEIKGIALYNVIMKNPNVLVAREIEQLICFIRYELGGKIEPLQLERLLSSTETRFFVGFDQKVNLLIQLIESEEKLLHVLNNVNLSKALCYKSFEDVEKMIEFLKPFGGIDLIVRRPVILNYNLEAQLIPRIGVITELSGNDLDGTGAVLMKFPMILSYSVKHVNDHIDVLRSFAGLSNEEIFKIFLIFPAVVSTSRERKLYPRINFLKQCGLDSEDIAKFLTKAPLFLALSFENIDVKLAFLVKMGYKYRHKDLAIALGAVTRTSCENMQKVIALFLSYGLSLADIHVMSKKHPQILQYSYSSLEQKLDYLIDEMGRDVQELLAFPAFLGYKLNDRIKIRFEERRKILGDGLSINKLLSVSAERFSTRKKKNPVPS